MIKPSIITSQTSPNTDDSKICVEFLILHYTACSLEKTLKIFQDSKKRVSSHFIIDTNGDIYELISAIDSPVKAFHAGESRWRDEKKQWNNFNSISLGIELINNNGNIFQYPKKQYDSLVQLTQYLREKYPALQDLNRILGHEHISGFRGKIDPGHQFPWEQYFSDLDSPPFPKREACLPLDIKERFDDFINNLSESEKDWSTLSLMLEGQYKHYLSTNE